MIEQRDIVVWAASAVLALGIFSTRWAKAKARNDLMRSLLAMDPERRKKMLDRMDPRTAMDLRQALLEKYGIMT